VPKAVIFLGGSLTEVEFIQAFAANDIRVVLVDRNADAPGREFADEFLHLSVTDADAICRALEPLRARYRFVAAYGIVDFMFKTVQVLSATFGIQPNAPQIYEEFTNKLKTKARLEKFGIRTPTTHVRGRSFDESTLRELAAASPSGMVVVKAHDSCNSEGVQIVRVADREAVRQAIRQAMELSGEFFCEEYVSGTLHNLDVVLSAAGATIVAITDRHRMADRLTSIAGFQQNPRQHPLYAACAKLAAEMRRTFSDYRGPLTADILAAEGALSVLEVSPHLHASKLQWLRDPRILSVWPRILSEQTPELQSPSDSENASAWVRIYDDESVYHDYFEAAWITDTEAFAVPLRFKAHELHKVLYMKSGSALLLREHVEAYVFENGGLSTLAENEARQRVASS
jgi:biotin carboxylase